MNSAPRSCYVLELSVQPGGSRWAELHAYTDPSHIHACLETFCDDRCGLSAYHAIWYRARLGIWVVQVGEVVDFIDLHPYISARYQDGPAMPLSDIDALRALVKAGGASDDELDSFDAFEDFILTPAWTPVAGLLPPLREPLLGPGEHSPVRFTVARPAGTYLDGALFGSIEAESGERIDAPFEIDGWDPREDDRLADHDIPPPRRVLDDADLAHISDDHDDDL